MSSGTGETAGGSPGPIVFIHIPKTAGTLVRRVLADNEPGPASRSIGNVFKGAGGVNPGREVVGRGRREPADLAEAGLISGHVPLGMRALLAKRVGPGRDRRLRFFTVLREPAERLLSHYFAVLEAGGGYKLPPLGPGATLEDALAGGHVHDNLHTRMLCDHPAPFHEVTGEMLEQAKSNLRDRIAAFGIAERLDETLVLAKLRLGLESILYRQANQTGRVNTTRPRGDDVPAELRSVAHANNLYDLELYRYAEELFAAAPEREGLEFAVALAALQAAKTPGELRADLPPPEAFSGSDREWRMLLRSSAGELRVRWELARLNARAEGRRIRVARLEVLNRRLEKAQAKNRRLEQQLDRLQNPGSTLEASAESTSSTEERNVEWP